MNIFVKTSPLYEALELPLPTYQTPQASGLDLFAVLKEPLKIEPLERVIVDNGLFLELPSYLEGQIRPRSGVTSKLGLLVVLGTIDADYRGEIKTLIFNLSSSVQIIEPKMRISQLVIHSIERVQLEKKENIQASLRGESGFGSTGMHS